MGGMNITENICTFYIQEHGYKMDYRAGTMGQDGL